MKRFLIGFGLFIFFFWRGTFIFSQTESIIVVADQQMDTNMTFMQGFINGGAQYNLPLAQHLKPASWLFGWDVQADYDYITPVATLKKTASIYSAYMNTFGPGDPMLLQPWTDGYVQWDAFVNNMVNLSISTSRPVDFWSVWGEPDASFSGTPAQYIELFRRTDNIIHSIDPAAKMVGPDFINFGIGELLFFIDTLDYLGIHPAAISWHEFGNFPELIPGHVQTFRDSIAVRPLLGDPEIHIQEYGDPNNRLVPGWSLGWLYYFEQAEIDWASRACFNEYDGINTWDDCWDGLSGMFMMDGVTPQPLYWLHRAYAELNQPMRLEIYSDQPRTVSMASKNDLNQEMKVIVGRYYSAIQGTQNASADVQVKIRHYPYGNNSTQTMVIQKIPAQTVAYTTPLSGPVTVFSGNITFVGDSATVALNSFADGDAYVIYINPDPSSILATENISGNETNGSKIQVYPNPTNGEISLDGLDGFDHVSIMNALGEIVYESAIHSTQMLITLSPNTTGLYTINLSSKERYVSRKLIIE